MHIVDERQLGGRIVAVYGLVVGYFVSFALGLHVFFIGGNRVVVLEVEVAVEYFLEFIQVLVEL